MSYTQVSAGGSHTVLLRSDGSAITCGQNFAGQCNIPPLEEGVSYRQVSAGWYHTVLLRSDGSVVEYGNNTFTQCNIPPLSGECLTSSFLRGTIIQCFCEVMAALLLVESTIPDNVAFLLWTRECPTSTFLPTNSYSASPKRWQRSCLRTE